MKRSLVAGLGFLALAARCRLRRRICRAAHAVQGAGLCRAVQLDRLLPGHQRRRRLGRFRLEWLRRQQQPVGRHDRRHRRLQLAGRRQPVGVRPRRRHRLDQRQGQHRLRRARTARPGTTGSAPCAAASATPSIASCRTSPAASRSATSKPTAPASPARRTPTSGWTVGVGIEGVIAGNWTAKVEYLYADLGDTTCSAVACGVATNVDLQLNIVRAGLNYRF